MSFSLSQATLSPRSAALTGTLQLINGSKIRDEMVKSTGPSGDAKTTVPFIEVVELAVRTLKSNTAMSISVCATDARWYCAETMSNYTVSKDFIAAVKNAAKLAGLNVAQNEDRRDGRLESTVRDVNLFVVKG